MKESESSRRLRVEEVEEGSKKKKNFQYQFGNLSCVPKTYITKIPKLSFALFYFWSMDLCLMDESHWALGCGSFLAGAWDGGGAQILVAVQPHQQFYGMTGELNQTEVYFPPSQHASLFSPTTSRSQQRSLRREK